MINRLREGKYLNTVLYAAIIFLPIHLSGQALVTFNDLSLAKTNSSSLLANLPSQQYGRMFNSDSLSKKRVRLVAAANIIGYGGTMVGLYSDWYKNYPQSSFHFFNDNNEWKQVDKVGHSYSAYIEGYGSMEMWRWTGMSRRKSALIGGLSALAYQSIIETMDAFSAEWGWSWGDMSANVFGVGLLVGQELAWNDQRIKFKFSFHKRDYGAPDLNRRANSLYGSSLSERLIKDYNGQTYWLSANLKSFMPQSSLPSWLNVALGYGADGMFGAVSNAGRAEPGGVPFDRRDIARYRQYYISPDIDLTKIRTRSKFLKVALGALNALKFPLPSLEYNSKGQLAFHIIHF
ncbi:MAG TPA: DUF2279 domain-containing protein [Segetibacter sp.]|nr:DUF2279 domain-containing protein [Segetibacter sp.]